MAGLSIVKSKSGLQKINSKLTETLNSLNYLSNYTSSINIMEDNLFVGWNKYNEYPIRVFENDDLKFIIEGKIYSRNNLTVEKELLDIFTDNPSEFILKNWLLSIDGDFIICVYNKRNNIIYVFNDILGRIPIYYRIDEENIIVSRYIKFITTLDNKISFDKTGMGEYLLLGYLLGERTLYQNIHQLRPSSLIIANTSSFSIKTINTFNFENREHKDKNLKEIVSNVSDLFSQACVNRSNNGNTNLIALSSGLDSRTIAACMSKNKIPFKTVTMVFKNGAAKEETEIAKYVSDFFSAEWNPMELYPPNGEDAFMLLKLKEGMSYLATSFLLPFYRKIMEEYGTNINFITGDKGDKVILSYDNPINKCSSIDELAGFIIGEHSMVSIDEVCSIIDVKKEDILHDLFNLLNSYPEQNIYEKYTHFRSIEKSHKLAFQSEDRHRRYFWTNCPLSASPFVTYLFNCSDDSKKMHKLFIALLESYSPEAAKILYTNFKSPITSLRAKLFMASVYYIYPLIKFKYRGIIKSIFFGGNPVINKESTFYRCIDEQLKNNLEISNYFNINSSSQLNSYRNTMLQSIFTLTSLIDDVTNESRTLKRYFSKSFDHMK